MNFNFQDQFYMCAQALTDHIPNHSTGILEDNSSTEMSDLKIYALLLNV